MAIIPEELDHILGRQELLFYQAGKKGQSASRQQERFNDSAGSTRST